MPYAILSILTAMCLTGGALGAAESALPWSAKALGYGRTEEAAKRDALTQAVRQVTEYVRHMDPPLLQWQVSEEFVEKNLLIGAGAPGEDQQIGDLKGKTWILYLKPPNVEQFILLNRQAIGARQQVERQAASRERLVLAGSIFGGLAALLALTMAYVHFTVRTKS